MGSGPNVQMGHPQIGPNLSQSKGRGAWLGALSRHGCVLAVFTTIIRIFKNQQLFSHSHHIGHAISDIYMSLLIQRVSRK